jgi:hypothetical protein
MITTGSVVNKAAPVMFNGGSQNPTTQEIPKSFTSNGGSQNPPNGGRRTTVNGGSQNPPKQEIPKSFTSKVQRSEKSVMNAMRKSAGMCEDARLLMPLCEQCIPGSDLKDGSFCMLTSDSKRIRKSLFGIARSRGAKGCNAYKYLSTKTLRQRHVAAGELLDTLKPRRILDIGAYSNPIHTFMTHCPSETFIVEPCGELSHDGSSPYFSREIECAKQANHSMLLNVFPVNIKLFMHTQLAVHFDAVVCMGCDVNYGPTWAELMSLPRPMTLILEFSVVAFSEHFPVKDTDGCTIVTVKDFDFSSCKECGYDDKQQMSHHGKSRRLVMFKCGDRPQLAERKSQAENVLQRPCTGAKGYKAMACVSERHIRDAAFMVVDARSATEEQSHAALARKSPLKRCTDNRCRCLPNFNLCRQWHNISASQLQDLKQKVKQYDTTQNDMQSVWDAIHPSSFKGF